MDLYVAVLTVSPVMLVAMAAAHRGRVAGLPMPLALTMGVLVMLPAMVAMVLSVIVLVYEKDFGQIRFWVAVSVTLQIVVSIVSIVNEMLRDQGTPTSSESAQV